MSSFGKRVGIDLRPEREKPPIHGCRTPKSCAALVRQAAATSRRRAQSDWARRENLVKMFRGDARDMDRVAKAITDGRKARALDITAGMDTEARDRIPLQVYCYLDPRSVIRGCR